MAVAKQRSELIKATLRNRLQPSPGLAGAKTMCQLYLHTGRPDEVDGGPQDELRAQHEYTAAASLDNGGRIQPDQAVISSDWRTVCYGSLPLLL